MSNFADVLGEGRDLVLAFEGGELAPVWFRDEPLAELRDLLVRGRSVILVGPSGVGKTALLHALGGAWGEGPLVEFSCTQFLSGTKYLGEWQSKVTSLAEECIAKGALLYVSDVWNLPRTGRSDNNDNNVLDALRPYVGPGRLQIVAEATPEILRQMERQPGFVSLFQKLTVPALTADQVDQTLAHAGDAAGLPLSAACRTSLVALTTRFLAARPQPGPALELLERVRDYREQKLAAGEPAELAPDLIERVFSVYSGLPLFVVSREATRPANEIRGWFQDRIVGQRAAIEAVVECIALFKAGLHDPDKPIGTFLFVGPTGVGKTELARCLARFLFGSDSRLLRFDLSEFKDYHSFETLVGSARTPGRPAQLADPIRSQPFQVVLLDELEKAHSNIWDALLGVLDEGRLTPPGGQTVDCRNVILIATSNVGAQDAERPSVGFDNTPRDHRAVVQKSLESHFRPEFLNRFQHTVVFHQLTADQVRTVARWEIRRIVDREGIAARNLVVEVEDGALDLVVETGFDPRYGARGLKREIQRRIVLPLAMTLMERAVEAGSILKVMARDGRIKVRVIETSEAREARQERQPVKLPDGRKLTKAQITERLEVCRARAASLAKGLDETGLLDRQDELEQTRRGPGFWSRPDEAARVLRDLDQVNRVLDRLDRLRMRGQELGDSLDEAATRRDIQILGQQAVRYEQSLEYAGRELLRIGPEGAWDALVEVAPVGGKCEARDLLVRTYVDWAKHRRMEVEWLCDPLDGQTAALLAVKGRHAYGFLRLEAGMHRVKGVDASSVARVTVAPWTDADGDVAFGPHRALKSQVGVFGSKLRSRLQTRGGLLLQNGRTLAQNRELAQEVAPSWSAAPASPDDIVRRVRVEPPRVKDELTGRSTGKPDALSGPSFHAMLCERVDLTWERRDGEA